MMSGVGSLGYFYKITIASKTIVFKGVEPQLRHLEPVGGESTLAHLSVHLHIFAHNLEKKQINNKKKEPAAAHGPS